MAIQETLERLSALQSVDSAIKALEEELERLPKAVAAAQEDLAAVKQKHEDAVVVLEAIRKKRRGLEQEIAAAEQNIVKFENDKLKVKTNEEFRALNNQIAGEKQKRSDLEDGVLESFDEEESASGQVTNLEQELKMVSARTADREAELKATGARNEERLKELKERRVSEVEGVERKLLNRYEALRRSKGGLAVAPVVRGTCGGCHTQQPPQRVNEVRKGDILLACEFCGRFLIGAVDETGVS